MHTIVTVLLDTSALSLWKHLLLGALRIYLKSCSYSPLDRPELPNCERTQSPQEGPRCYQAGVMGALSCIISVHQQAGHAKVKAFSFEKGDPWPQYNLSHNE